MIAVYVTYVIQKTTIGNRVYNIGDIITSEYKIHGIAPKVADRTRETWQSAVRYSMENNSKISIGLINGCRVDKNRNLVLGDKVILEEDKVNSAILQMRIESVR